MGRQRFAAAVLLFGAWAALVVMGLAPVEPFVATVREALLALGVFHATMTIPGDQS